MSDILTNLEPVRIATTNLNSGLKTIKADIFHYGVGQHGRRRRADHRRRREKKRQTKSRTKGSSLINNWEQKQLKIIVNLNMTGSRRVKTTNKLTSTEQKNTDCFAWGLQNTKVAVASTSSPGAPTTGAPLKPRQVVDIKPTEQTDSHNLQTNNDALFALQEV